MNQLQSNLSSPSHPTAMAMPILGVRIDPWIEQLPISPAAKLKMQEASARIRGFDAFSRFWNRVLTPSEIRAIGSSPEVAFSQKSIVNYFVELRAMSPARALVEIASHLDHLSANDRDWLLRELGEIPPIQTHADKPAWDRQGGVLRFRGRSVDISRRANNQRSVLESFDLTGWKPLAPNPFDVPTNVDDQKIHATLRDLNSKTDAIGLHFATEKGRICWMAPTLSSLQSSSQ